MKNKVYKITTPSSKYYIGSTNNLDRRFREHCGLVNTKNHGSDYIRHAASKYGVDNLKLEVLFTFSTREEAYKKEQELLDCYYTDDLCMNTNPSACGYNTETAKKARACVKNVFDINKHMQENPELRDKQAESVKDFYKKNPKAGARSSQRQRGSKYIEVINPEGVSIGKFEDVKSLKKAYPQFVSQGNICSVARGDLKHYKKHIFKYVD